MEKRAFEPTGLVPRSIARTFERFGQQLLPGTERRAIQEFRVSRYQVLVSVRCIIDLFLIPLLVNLLGKELLLVPLTQHLWNTHQHEVFLNTHQEERALAEMHDFSERIFFESLLIDEKGIPPHKEEGLLARGCWQPLGRLERLERKRSLGSTPSSETSPTSCKSEASGRGVEVFGKQSSSEKIQEKTYQLASFYNQQSVVAVANLLGDTLTLLSVALLSLRMRPQVVILKSFVSESIYSLSDTTKSFLLLLLTDLLVGFHSPRGWEIAIETALRHFGLPENPDFVFLFVATLPVMLDTVFKYWIFRYLNKISPSTVATYHSMIE